MFYIANSAAAKGRVFKVSGPRGSLGTKVLFNIYDDIIALTSLKHLVQGPRHD